MKTDQRLQADVEQELRWDPSVRSEDIGVSVTGGVVQLDGHVDSYFGRWAAERAAMRVSDAKAVASEIKVLPSAAIRTDEDLARALAQRSRFRARVRNGEPTDDRSTMCTLTPVSTARPRGYRGS